MSDPNSPLPPGDIPISEPPTTPPLGAVPGATPPPTVNYGHGPTGTGGGIMDAPGAYNGPAPDKDSKTMALLAHLLGIITCWLGPLIIWLLKRDSSPFVEDQAKEALNFQLTILIGYIVSIFLIRLFCIGLLLEPIVFFTSLILGIIAITKVNAGIAYRYPFALRIIK